MKRTISVLKGWFTNNILNYPYKYKLFFFICTQKSTFSLPGVSNNKDAFSYSVLILSPTNFFYLYLCISNFFFFTELLHKRAYCSLSGISVIIALKTCRTCVFH